MPYRKYIQQINVLVLSAQFCIIFYNVLSRTKSATPIYIVRTD